MNQQYRFGLFVLLALVQLYFPGKMVYDSNKVLWLGQAFKFETRPVDPADPFRGRYVALNFAATQFEAPAESAWQRNETVFVLLETDAAGYAKIKGLSRSKPAQQEAYVSAKVSYVWKNQVTLFYPFSRFYMEEGKAQKAEIIYRRVNAGYALVKVYKGEAVLEDVLVKGKSLRELAR
ncbi:MAG TPA: GDYXXLXY domain-containing protein [Haliscomenobacter sp.]|mgnify:FL=1|uniref:GDYXXLXY domain-containing protein n=1 Tax=Haliscomenobacter sp. TaxID=2717303 RepID=UPI002BFB3E3B|nr:GDYXXLXY domain-containing protein [Haliscomenobacter sp.]HOY17884.1 GDYXXLXY domain-containing protein [Haliscomenobacter sp.]HPH18740.1 GDYXXLXY domain-containing protein [Haliscomenobacter sp.]